MKFNVRFQVTPSLTPGLIRAPPGLVSKLHPVWPGTGSSSKLDSADSRPGQVFKSDLIQLGRFSDSGCKRNARGTQNALNAEAAELLRPWGLTLTSTSRGREQHRGGCQVPPSWGCCGGGGRGSFSSLFWHQHCLKVNWGMLQTVKSLFAQKLIPTRQPHQKGLGGLLGRRKGGKQIINWL